MKQAIAGIMMFVCAGTSFGMIMGEEDYESGILTYQIVKYIRERPLPKQVEDTLIVIVGRNDDCDKGFFSFLFPKNLQRYDEIPRFIFTDLFKNLNIYEYYRDIFEYVRLGNKNEQDVTVIENYLTEQLKNQKCATISCVDYELYKLGKRFSMVLTYLRQKKLYDDSNSFNVQNHVVSNNLYLTFQNKVLRNQVSLLSAIVHSNRRHDILSLEKIMYLIFSSVDLQTYQNAKQNAGSIAIFDTKALEIKQNLELSYATNMKGTLRTLIRNRYGIDVKTINDMDFTDLFLSFQESKEVFVAHEIGLVTESERDGDQSLFIARRN